MVDHSRWAEIVANAELALACGRPLDPSAERLARMVVKTNELAADSRDIFLKAMMIQERCFANTSAALRETNERLRRVAKRTEAIVGRARESDAEA